MESSGAFQGGEWDSLNMFFSNTQHVFMDNVFDPYPSAKDLRDLNVDTPQSFFFNSEVDTNYTTMCDSFLCPPPDLHANDGGNILDMSNFIDDSPNDLSDIHIRSEVPFVPEFMECEMEQAVCLNVGEIVNSSCSLLEEYSIPSKEMHPKRKLGKSGRGVDDNFNSHFPEISMKKHRISKDASMNKSNLGLKNHQKINDTGLKNSCSSSSEDSMSVNLRGEVTLDSVVCANTCLNGKTGSRRGSATDPQSLYARRRRERINERLRILQSLIPNGTKVDMSTMLEEAVHYVKFLQLQIKLLSSDELWIYAAVAYNGLNIDLNQII